MTAIVVTFGEHYLNVVNKALDAGWFIKESQTNSNGYTIWTLTKEEVSE